MYRVLGIDPGNTTGLTVVEFSDIFKAEILASAQLPSVEPGDFLNVGETIELLIASHEVDIVAIEQFHITQRTITLSRQPTALHLIGVSKWLVFQSEAALKIQNASDAKSTWPNARIAFNAERGALSGTEQVMKPHGYDSLRHALLGGSFVGDINFDTGEEDE